MFSSHILETDGFLKEMVLWVAENPAAIISSNWKYGNQQKQRRIYNENTQLKRCTFFPTNFEPMFAREKIQDL